MINLENRVTTDIRNVAGFMYFKGQVMKNTLINYN